MQLLRISGFLNAPELACEFLAHWVGGTTLTEVAGLLGYGERRITKLVSDGFERRRRHTASYDRTSKLWLSGMKSRDLHGPKSPRDAIAVLQALQIWSRDTPAEVLFPVVDTRALRRDPAPDTFRVLMGACARKRVVDVVYQARTRKLAASFSPHTLVIASNRNHFRGYSVFEPEGQGHFWDLVPSRVLSAELRPPLGKRREGYVDARDDADWHAETTLHLNLVAGLPDAMRQAIRYENYMTSDRLVIGPVRQALLSYVRAEYINRRYEDFDGPVWAVAAQAGGAISSQQR